MPTTNKRAHPEAFCLRCESSRCSRGPKCELLSVADDGTVSVTMARKLTRAEVEQLRRSCQLLALAEVRVKDHWLFALSCGSETGDRLDESEDGKFPLFGCVSEALSLRGGKLATAILRTGIDDLYGRYNILGWNYQEHESIDDWVKTVTTRPANLPTTKRAECAWDDLTLNVVGAVRLARQAAKTGDPSLAAAMMRHLREAFRSQLVLDGIQPAPPACSSNDADIKELDEEIRQARPHDRPNANR